MKREVTTGVRVNAERLKYWRHRRVISRQELVRRAGIGASTYNNLESGYRTRAKPETLQAIASALRISPEKLVIAEEAQSSAGEASKASLARAS